MVARDDGIFLLNEELFGTPGSSKSQGRVTIILHPSESRWLATPKSWRFVRGHDKPRLM